MGSVWETYVDTTEAVDGGIPSDVQEPIIVFALRPNNTTQRHKGMKLYRYRIWRNGTLEHDFKPCKDTINNVIGVYDLVGTNGFITPGRFNDAPDFVLGND